MFLTDTCIYNICTYMYILCMYISGDISFTTGYTIYVTSCY